MRYLQCPLLIIALLLFSLPAQAAELTGADRQHAQNAFLFVGRDNWNEALLHARKAKNQLLHKTIQWLYYREKNSGAGFEEISYFLRQNTDWPSQSTLKLRAEEALFTSGVSDTTVKEWFAQHPPITGRGKMLYAQILEKTHAPAGRVTDMLRDGWVSGDFDRQQENAIIANYRSRLRETDHTARIERLLWESKYSGAERMLSLIPASTRPLYKSWLALLKEERNAAATVNNVPSALRNHPGLIYARMVWRAKNTSNSNASDSLFQLSNTPPYPEKWWIYREKEVRRFITEKNYSQALKLLHKHGLSTEDDAEKYADALWLTGWVQLEFMKNPGDAYKQFYAMYQSVKYPVSRARAAYWAARAADKNRNADIARKWYNQAAAYPTTFFGQIALAELDKGAALDLPGTPKASSQQASNFERKEIVRLTHLLAEANQDNYARAAVINLVDTVKTPEEVALAVKMGLTDDKPAETVRAAKRALRRDIIIREGYPIIQTPNAAIEKALILAITRQESEFDRRATSPSNAMGYMQLLPSTAKEVSRKMGMRYNQSELFNGEYNLRLGSHYLERLINLYDGSYILGIAAYNAGPGRVRGWVRERGYPKGDIHDILNWIEMIPFTETRIYVYRVLENLQVYRHMLAPGRPPVRIKDDLLRGSHSQL